MAVVAVADSGSGIPADRRDSLFEMSERDENSDGNGWADLEVDTLVVGVETY
ncbi:hypothetical protein [Salinigranum sp. GCM10025319]|uniref:hypothetical protein n=1 Tax=Salinigranum sp. GCM10025319 TaxID=3252687 RepID=UPI00360B4451